MSERHIQLSVIGGPLPAVKAPFVVLIDTNDAEWSDGLNVKRLTKDLLDSGCRFFVCFGTGAEAVHDLIDDVIVEYRYDDIITTFHEDEPRADVAEFFGRVAVVGMNDALVLVRDLPAWKVLF